MRTKSRVIFTSLILIMLLTLLTGIALASTIFHVKHASLDDHQGTCLDSGGVVTSWHFVINQVDEEDAPASIHVIWDNGFEADVAVGNINQNMAHYTTNAYPGWLVEDATALLPDDWTGQFNLSHVECTDPEDLNPSKTADPSFSRDWTWEIDKEEDGEYEGFTGDSWVHNYLVTVTPTSEDSNWEVNGTITIVNPNPFAVFALVSDSVNNGGSCVVGTPSLTIPAGSVPVAVDYTCTWTSEPSQLDGTNTAVITWGQLEFPATADFDFGKTTPAETGFPVITVDDSWYGPLGSADREEVSFPPYSRTFTCDDDDDGEHVNIATINETGAEASATVNVDCYALDVSKDAFTSFTRTYDWSIDKSANESALTLATGEVFTVTYAVELDAYYVDSDWAVAGTITVHNPAPITAVINSVTDYVSGDAAIPAPVDCGDAIIFPYELAAGADLVCSYVVDLPNADPRTNSVTAELQNTPSGTTNFSGYANVSFAAATISEIDECVNVVDSFEGSTATGTVCYDDLPVTFTYNRVIGPYGVCGNFTVPNIATALTNDTSMLISDSWTVNVTVPCEGCTLTQGYWKTHSSNGPAPYDDNWAGRDITFFLSTQSWYEVFWTPPAGNAYYTLAHQYMAAKLNIWNGASSTGAVDNALAWAENFFSSYNPIIKVSKSDKAAVIFNAGILGSYNEGSIGPGHCSE